MGGKDLTAEDTAKLLGVKTGAVYKGIDHHNIPAVKEIVNGKTEVRVPAAILMVCIQKRKSKLQSRVDHLTKAEHLLRSHINGH